MLRGFVWEKVAGWQALPSSLRSDSEATSPRVSRALAAAPYAQ